MIDRSRLQETLGIPELAWLVDRLRQRLERGDDLQGSVTLRHAAPEQRAAVDRFFGRRPSRGDALTIECSALDMVLRRAELCESLKEAIETLTGPILNRRGLQTETNRRWTELFREAEECLGACQEAATWLREIQATGLLRRLSSNDLQNARKLFEQAVAVVVRLPVKGLSLAELAAAVTGDSHALDLGQPVGTLVLRAAAILGGLDQWDTTQSRRDAWASVGVLCDELSAPLLVLNLPADMQTLTGRALNLHASAGEPYRVSVRQLLRHPPVFDRDVIGPKVYVCENPTVVAAVANRLGPASSPLVCIDGQPKTAARLLLDQLSGTGIALAYHGDFDWEGLRIANLVIKRHGATAWRMSATCYSRSSGGTRLRGTPVAACWDPELSVTMLEAKRAVHEELVLDDLAKDLARSRAG